MPLSPTSPVAQQPLLRLDSASDFKHYGATDEKKYTDTIIDVKSPSQYNLFNTASPEVAPIEQDSETPEPQPLSFWSRVAVDSAFLAGASYSSALFVAREGMAMGLEAGMLAPRNATLVSSGFGIVSAAALLTLGIATVMSIRSCE